ncbi:MAG: type I-E CRISPR-associated protein Cas6/Cse3/CasE [Chloracidobacterium sp.]
MIYLSKLTFDTTNHRVFQLLRSPYRVHAAIMRAFPPNHQPREETPDRSQRVLFRIEPPFPPSRPLATVLVQSLLPPDWKPLGLELGSSLSVEERFFAPEFRAGDQFWFRLRANPTIRRRARGNCLKLGRRQGIYGREKLLTWLARKGVDGGASFSLSEPEPRIIDEGYWKAQKGQHHRQVITIHTVLFEGKLTVTSPELFLETLKFGIGSAKGFGCGMVSLARV